MRKVTLMTLLSVITLVSSTIALSYELEFSPGWSFGPAEHKEVVGSPGIFGPPTIAHRLLDRSFSKDGKLTWDSSGNAGGRGRTQNRPAVLRIVSGHRKHCALYFS